MNGPERGVFIIERAPRRWYALPYVVSYGDTRVPHVAMTLRGARWWVRHRGRKWLEEQRQGYALVERVRV